MVEQFDLKSMGCNSPEAIHLMVEAKKLAFADRETYVADPEYLDIPIAGLVSKDYAKERAKLIDPERAAHEVAAGDPWPHQGAAGKPRGTLSTTGVGGAEEDTTCFAVVDRWGNAVCQLQSIQSAWGSSLIAGDTGVLLNNRMTYWHLEESHVDCLQPGRRVRHTMNPVMVFQPVRPRLNQRSVRRHGSGPLGNGLRHPRCGYSGPDQHAGDYPCAGLWNDGRRSRGSSALAEHPQTLPSPRSLTSLPMNFTWRAAFPRRQGPNWRNVVIPLTSWGRGRPRAAK